MTAAADQAAVQHYTTRAKGLLTLLGKNFLLSLSVSKETMIDQDGEIMSRKPHIYRKAAKMLKK